MSRATGPNSLEQQLFHPPEESLRILREGTLAGAPPRPTTSGQARAPEFVRDWLEAILQPAYRPPPGALFFAFAQEAGNFDVVRVRYVVDDLTIESAHTGVVASLTFLHSSPLPCHERAQRLVARVFEPLEVIELVLSGGDERTAHGTASRLPGVTDVHWWCSPERVSFSLLKRVGDGQIAVSFEPLTSRVWFKALGDDPLPAEAP